MHTLLVTGSRGWSDAYTIHQALSRAKRNGNITQVLHGACPKGADMIANHFAHLLHLDVVQMPADWEAHGNSAGFRRNDEMLDTEPAMVAGFWIPPSRGTAHCLLGAMQRGLRTVAYVQRNAVTSRLQGRELLAALLRFCPEVRHMAKTT